MKTVFLDKDGTLVEDVPYNVDPARISLKPGAREGARALAAAGYALAVVTNQSGIARGYFTPEALGPVAGQLQDLLGVRFAGFFYCPHHPEGVVARYAIDCDCRKPRPGMILNAARAIGADLAASWMIGDILHDVEAGNRAGCRTVLIDNGGETEWVGGPYRAPTLVCRDLAEAAGLIVALPSSSPGRGGGVGGQITCRGQVIRRSPACEASRWSRSDGGGVSPLVSRGHPSDALRAPPPLPGEELFPRKQRTPA